MEGLNEGLLVQDRFLCQLCYKTISTNQRKFHIIGKGHNIGLQRENTTDKRNRSVCITEFYDPFDSLEYFDDYFKDYGVVENTYISKSAPNTVIVRFFHQASAKRVIEAQRDWYIRNSRVFISQNLFGNGANVDHKPFVVQRALGRIGDRVPMSPPAPTISGFPPAQSNLRSGGDSKYRVPHLTEAKQDYYDKNRNNPYINQRTDYEKPAPKIFYQDEVQRNPPRDSLLSTPIVDRQFSREISGRTALLQNPIPQNTNYLSHSQELDGKLGRPYHNRLSNDNFSSYIQEPERKFDELINNRQLENQYSITSHVSDRRIGKPNDSHQFLNNNFSTQPRQSVEKRPIGPMNTRQFEGEHYSGQSQSVDSKSRGLLYADSQPTSSVYSEQPRDADKYVRPNDYPNRSQEPNRRYEQPSDKHQHPSETVNSQNNYERVVNTKIEFDLSRKYTHSNEIFTRSYLNSAVKNDQNSDMNGKSNMPRSEYVHNDNLHHPINDLRRDQPRSFPHSSKQYKNTDASNHLQSTKVRGQSPLVRYAGSTPLDSKNVDNAVHGKSYVGDRYPRSDNNRDNNRRTNYREDYSQNSDKVVTKRVRSRSPIKRDAEAVPHSIGTSGTSEYPHDSNKGFSNQDFSQRYNANSIQKDNRHSDSPRPIREEFRTNFENWLPSLSHVVFTGSFEQQFTRFLEEVHYNVYNWQKLKHLMSDVEKFLRHDFPGSRVQIYGSAHTNVAIIGEPVSLEVNIPEECRNRLSHATNVKKIRKHIVTKLWDHIKKEPMFENIGKTLSNGLLLKHVSSGYEVLLTFMCPVYIFKSEFLKFYLSLDERLVPLLVFLIYWGRTNGVVEWHRMNENCITALAIFYLQRLPKPILPPVHFVQKEMHIKQTSEEYWRFAYTTRDLPKNENRSDYLTLIEDFFLFYKDFDFTNNVVSPLCGLSIPSSIFSNLNELPNQLQKYVKAVKNYIKPLPISNVMTVQDPIELNRNVCYMVSENSKMLFQQKCLWASKLMEDCRKNNSQDSLMSKLLVSPGTPTKPIVLDVDIQTTYSGGLNKSDALSIFDKLVTLLEEIWTNVLKAKFSSERDVIYGSNKHLSECSITYDCAVFYNVWASRDQYAKKVPFNSCSILWEAAISNKIINTFYQNQMPNLPLLQFIINARVLAKEKCIRIKVEFLNVTKELCKEFSNFFLPVIEFELKKISVV